MNDAAVLRRLSAILAADVAGYSRLIAADEVGTLSRFRKIRAEVVDPAIARFGGVLVGTAGDSLLVEFTNALAAVECAIACQNDLARLNDPEPGDRRILFRMGVNLGDVIAADGTIHGDGVNVAARIEKLAEPGGICVSKSVHDLVAGKLGIAFRDIGEQEFKNIAQPVRAYAVGFAGDGMRAAPATRPAGRTVEDPLSIAVLPFENMSGDLEQEYFSDGVTEDIITELSRFRELRVIARNSSFAFKGQNVPVGEIGKKLGVQFIVEGSVRRSGNRLRVTAQLIEAAPDRHLWAERYDRDMEDIFAIQDEIARSVASRAAGFVRGVGVERTRSRPTESLTAYELVLKARAYIGRYGTDPREEEAFLRRSIELDPGYALAHARLGGCLNYQAHFDGSPGRRELAAESCRTAIRLNPEEAIAHSYLGQCLLFLNKKQEAKACFERAARINPNDPHAGIHHAIWFCYSGQFAEGLGRIRECLKRDPFGFDWFWDINCWALTGAGDYSEAVAAYRRLETPAPWSHVYCAIAEVNLGHVDTARTLLEKARRMNPSVSMDGYIRMDPWEPEILERLLSGLRRIE